MPKPCHSCGASVLDSARFCNKCGARLVPTQPAQQSPPEQRAFAEPPPSYQSPPSYPQPQYSAPSTASGLQPNIAGLLCYVLGFVSGILFLVIDPYNKDRFVRFHAFQSIFLTVVFIVAYLVLGIMQAILPWFLDFIPGLAMFAVWLGTFILFIFSMFKAYNGEVFKVPIIGEIAEKQAG